MGWFCQPQTPTLKLEDQGIPFCLGHQLSPFWLWKPYQWQRYCQHSSQGHLTTQAPTLRQSTDTLRGSCGPLLHNSNTEHGVQLA